MILNADARAIPLADQSVHCIVTSPPYWGLRDYGVAGQLGLERAPEEYVAALVAVFREVWRVLRDDGTCWLNLGDSYHSGDRGGYRNDSHRWENSHMQSMSHGTHMEAVSPNRLPQAGLKAKDLVGIPWRVAFALQADGWYLRSDIIWAKPNPMPESVTDRPTKSHEYLFLLAKRAWYYYDSTAILEQVSLDRALYAPSSYAETIHNLKGRRAANGTETKPAGRNRRSVWEIATQPYPDAHFATFPEGLVEPCILAGTSERGVCATCGAPWERVTEVTYSPANHGGTSLGIISSSVKQDSRELPGNGSPGYRTKVNRQESTVGWRATCACAAPTMRPFVLDPFAGSGTVGLVCQRLGRRFVGFDLKPDYCRMAYQRTAQLGLV